MTIPDMPKWFDADGKPVSCTEKIKVMQQNMEELHEMAQEAFEDAILMGCTEAQLKDYLRELIDSLDNPYAS
ncbi:MULTISPECIES: hypothetical protein [Vitreoscilla]|uniref:Uncharacterized protein n=1 Tax=Vitreoscilla stercoraria TaxID=61 RepID=A0ABY4EAX1_VITST|nr:MULTISPECIES: hypothetical protein [Vitreoscilla]AUZ05705.1 hypothetical protein ADP71_23450 [Vitreoscilla sp. C1]UOO92896.1 hypothetical protein LVJ81_02310 [Vitreoscilla stercoraria]